jgi:hypothetical protein
MRQLTTERRISPVKEELCAASLGFQAEVQTAENANWADVGFDAGTEQSSLSRRH